MVDWTPTFLNLAGVTVPDGMDGVNVWDNLNEDTEARDTIIHNIDENKDQWQATITHGHYKMIWGQEQLLKKSHKSQSNQVKLFNVFDDPEESTDISEENPDVIEKLKATVLKAKNISFVEADYPKGSVPC